MDKGVCNCTAKVYIADSLSCLCVCLLVVMICSQVKGKWMHILMPSARVSRMSNTQLIFAHH